jgi:hypothetical protein
MNSKCKSQFCIPELEDKVLLEYDLNVTNTLVGYDMIIGRDILEDLGSSHRLQTKGQHLGSLRMSLQRT